MNTPNTAPVSGETRAQALSDLAEADAMLLPSETRREGEEANLSDPKLIDGGEEHLTPKEAWRILVEMDDRTSPEEYPDHALITYDELERFMQAAIPPADTNIGELIERLTLGSAAIGDDGEWVSIRRYVRDQAAQALSSLQAERDNALAANRGLVRLCEVVEARAEAAEAERDTLRSLIEHDASGFNAQIAALQAERDEAIEALVDEQETVKHWRDAAYTLQAKLKVSKDRAEAAEAKVATLESERDDTTKNELKLFRRVQELEEQNARLEKDAAGRRSWLWKAKQERGYSDNVSFDTVWAETCAKADALEASQAEVASLREGIERAVTFIGYGAVQSAADTLEAALSTKEGE